MSSGEDRIQFRGYRISIHRRRKKSDQDLKVSPNQIMLSKDNLAYGPVQKGNQIRAGWSFVNRLIQSITGSTKCIQARELIIAEFRSDSKAGASQIRSRKISLAVKKSDSNVPTLFFVQNALQVNFGSVLGLPNGEILKLAKIFAHITRAGDAKKRESSSSGRQGKVAAGVERKIRGKQAKQIRSELKRRNQIGVDSDRSFVERTSCSRLWKQNRSEQRQLREELSPHEQILA
ncbi:Acyl-CoA synthetase family member 4 [Dorcoceras hygrometricum]|uniref:Acyl-CoA synthetase family member 4 n=1 Tax=Dorcoceras hygrometricum TaxID=472368 RepID=A0A2Z7BG82_9LAMI|nr:Acyl-CoA synthetase family member 4 [Dorcoceras hygrometricum]